MRILNTTRIDSDLVREVIAFCRPAGISNFDVVLKNSRDGWRGRAYSKGCGSYHSRICPFVVIGVGPSSLPFPSKWKARGGYLTHLELNQEEELVHILAHELRHLWQAKHPKGWRVFGARGKYSERDADAFAIRQVRAWRKAKRVMA
jgi:hypothetical protein